MRARTPSWSISRHNVPTAKDELSLGLELGFGFQARMVAAGRRVWVTSVSEIPYRDKARDNTLPR